MKRIYVYAGAILTLCLGVCGILVVLHGKDITREAPDKTAEEQRVDTTVPESKQDENQGENEGQQEELAEPLDDEYVKVSDYIPDVVVDLRYATTNNFTGTAIYDFQDAYLRYGTVKKLAVAQERLKALGFRIKIWDAYRPFSAQERLWQVCPNPRYVANPANGMKAHNLGGTVDMTIVTLEGADVEMPSEFDDFSVRADRDYSDVSEVAGNHGRMLEQIMTECGFAGYDGEWWDYSDTTQYAPVDFEP